MKLILFGDSLTYGYGVSSNENIETLIKNAYPSWKVINKGINGDSTRDARKRFERDVASLKPDIVTFLFGSNDSAMGEGYITLYEYNINLEMMIEKLKLINPKCKIIMITPPPVDDTVFMPYNYNERLEPYVENCRNLAKKHNLVLADFNLHLKEVIKNGIDEYLQEDGEHLSKKGYIEFFKCIEKSLKNSF